MDGRHLYGNYAGNMQGAGYYNAMAYGQGHGGMPVPYGSGPPAGAPQYLIACLLKLKVAWQGT